MLKAVLIAVSLAYPFVIYFGIQRVGAPALLLLLALVLLLRMLSARSLSERAIPIVVIALILLVGALGGAEQGLSYYPVAVNVVLFVLFVGSLFAKQSIVERLARLREPDLPIEAIRYTRRVTMVWVLFFLVNGSVSAVTVVIGDRELWLLYNGLIAYLLMALLAGAEWLVRQRIRGQQG